MDQSRKKVSFSLESMGTEAFFFMINRVVSIASFFNNTIDHLTWEMHTWDSFMRNKTYHSHVPAVTTALL